MVYIGIGSGALVLITTQHACVEEGTVVYIYMVVLGRVVYMVHYTNQYMSSEGTST